MIFFTTFRVKPFPTKAEAAESMNVSAEKGAGPGATGRYVAAAGSHGVVPNETDDGAAVYRSILKNTQWIESDITTMLTIEQAIPHIMDALA